MESRPFVQCAHISAPHIPSVITALPKKVESTLAIRAPEIPKPSLIPAKVDVVVKPSTNTLGMPSETTVAPIPVPLKTTIQIPATVPAQSDSTLVKSQPNDRIVIATSKPFNLIEWFLDLIRGL